VKARAPGKIVLSGAYSVLEGAPALVAAVDRYVWADTARQPSLVTPEVRQAMLNELGIERPPWFDAAQLRQAGGPGGDRKLGLGSSAAILVASLAASLLEVGLGREQLAGEVLGRALRAHRAAQGGGSGIDVAASCYGGVLCCLLNPATGELSVRPHELPAGLCLEVFSCPGVAETRVMLQAVAGLKQSRPSRYRAALGRASDGAERAAGATTAAELVGALAEQLAALEALGRAAGVAIVTAEVAELAASLSGSAACFVPAGAGGGDVAVLVGEEPVPQHFRARAAALGVRAVDLRLGAPGVQPVLDEPPAELAGDAA